MSKKKNPKVVTLALRVKVILFGIILFNHVEAQLLDTSFQASLTRAATIKKIEKGENGRHYVIGDFKLINNKVYDSKRRNNIARLNPDRSIDETFKLSDEFLEHEIRDFKVQNGKIMLISSPAQNGLNQLYILNEDGSIDDSFEVDSSISGVHKAIYDGSNFFAVVESAGIKIAKLSNSGELDTEYGLHSLEGSSSSNLLPLKSGQILVTGNYTKYDAQDVGPIFKLNADGTLDQSFNTGSSSIGDLEEVEIASDGSIYAVGFFKTFNNTPANGGIIKLTSNGVIDNSFDPNILNNIFSGAPRSIEIDEANKLYVMGRDLVGGISIKLARLNTDGTIDNGFTIKGVSFDDSNQAFSLALFEDKIIFSGDFNQVDQEQRLAIATLDLNGELLPVVSEFTKETLPTDALVQNDKKILVSGDFQFANGASHKGIVRLNTDGSVDESFKLGFDFNQSASNEINALAIQEDGKILIAGLLINASVQESIIRLDTNGNIDTSFSADPRLSRVYRIHLMEDGRILVMQLGITNSTIGSMAILNSDGSIDESFSTSAFEGFDIIHEFSVLEDGTFLVGGTRGVSGFLIRLTPDGSTVSTFSFDDTVDALAVTSSNWLIGGTYTRGGGFATTSVLLNRTDMNGELEDQNSIGVVGTTNFGFYRDLLMLNDSSLIVAGLYDFINSQPRNSLAKTTLSGKIDKDFIFNLTGWSNKIVRLDEDNIVVLGQFSEVNNTSKFSIAKIRIVNTPPEITGTSKDLNTDEEQALILSLEDLQIEDPDDGLADMSLIINDGENYSVEELSITPVTDFNGTLNILVMISDGKDSSEVFNLSIDVNPVNDAPVITAFNGTATTPEEANLAISINDFSITDPDNAFPDDYSLSIADGDNYSVDGTNITPDTDFNGTLTVSITTNDGTVNSEAFDISIEVTPVNDTPIITGTTLETITDSETPIELNLTDLVVTDPDNSYPSDFSLIIGSGDNYTVSSNSIIPTAEFIGNIVVPVIVNDGTVDSEAFNITIEVTEVTSLELEFVSKKVDLYPNPTEDILNLTIENQIFDDIKIRILDLKGDEILSYTYKKEVEVLEESISLSPLRTGIYLVEISQGVGFKTIKKIIKN